MNLEDALIIATYFVCYCLTLKLCVNACFIFLLLLNKLKALRIFFVL